MSLIIVEHDWPGGFKGGEAVTYSGRDAHVIDVPAECGENGENGKVPIMYDDEGSCFVFAPPEDLERRFKQLQKKGGQ